MRLTSITIIKNKDQKGSKLISKIRKNIVVKSISYRTGYPLETHKRIYYIYYRYRHLGGRDPHIAMNIKRSTIELKKYRIESGRDRSNCNE